MSRFSEEEIKEFKRKQRAFLKSLWLDEGGTEEAIEKQFAEFDFYSTPEQQEIQKKFELNLAKRCWGSNEDVKEEKDIDIFKDKATLLKFFDDSLKNIKKRSEIMLSENYAWGTPDLVDKMMKGLLKEIENKETKNE